MRQAGMPLRGPSLPVATWRDAPVSATGSPSPSSLGTGVAGFLGGVLSGPLLVAMNTTRFVRGADTSARLKIAGPIAPHATASKTADSQIHSTRPVNPATIQAPGRSSPVRKVPIARTLLLPERSAIRPHATVVPSAVMAATEDQTATWVKLSPSSPRKYGTTNGAASITTNCQ